MSLVGMKTLLFFIIGLCLYTALPMSSSAIEDPLTTPNNKFGIHILFDTELDEASRLINSNGGEWGYVVIPIQAGDRDLLKWQQFMNKAREFKVIPILRLATENYYFNTKVWREPREEDILDFANFLNSLDWPVKNRYVVIFNEVNRNDEWGGKADPAEYAQLLSYANTVFKSLNNDFFIIASGMDNASINGNGAVNQFDYYRRMNQTVPGIFNQIDGISSHAYPNPNFSSHPLANTSLSISSFKLERELIESMSNKKMPVFITETGWSSENIEQDTLAGYYDTAFSKVWNDPGVVAITPFLLRAGQGPFQKFTFILEDGQYTKPYEMIKSFKKIKGEPSLTAEVLATESSSNQELSRPEVKQKKFSRTEDTSYFSKSEVILETLKFFFGL